MKSPNSITAFNVSLWEGRPMGGLWITRRTFPTKINKTMFLHDKGWRILNLFSLSMMIPKPFSGNLKIKITVIFGLWAVEN